MIINVHHDVILEIQDFATNDEVEQVLSTALQKTEWRDAAEEGFWMNRIVKIETEAQQNFYNKLQNMFLSFDKINTLESISRFFPGDSMPVHEDEIGDKNIAYGAIIYLNDDYNGGELYYPDYDFKIKPKAGSMLMHPGNVSHQVTEVSKKTRYFLTTFIHGTATNPAKLRNFVND